MCVGDFNTVRVLCWRLRTGTGSMASKRLETCAVSISAVVSHKSATAPDWEVDGSAGGLSSAAGAGRVTWFKVFTGYSTLAGVGVLSLIASGSVGSC